MAVAVSHPLQVGRQMTQSQGMMIMFSAIATMSNTLTVLVERSDQAVTGLVVRFLADPSTSPSIPVVKDLPTVVANLTNWITGILFGVATLFLTIGGALYLMAGGDPSQVERAKSALKSALTGYALALMAPVLMGILNSILGG
jgi:hypothetical protein